MAYTLHITRKNDWIDKEPSIKKEELEYLINNGFLEKITENHMNAWDAKKNEVYFSFSNGDIISNPRNQKDIEYIKQIAELLHAKVQGDDGELY